MSSHLPSPHLLEYTLLDPGEALVCSDVCRIVDDTEICLQLRDTLISTTQFLVVHGVSLV